MLYYKGSRSMIISAKVMYINDESTNRADINVNPNNWYSENRTKDHAMYL